ncbi:MAG: DinB family protein [Planctomycetota bacterium]|nr:DinB family protein [Planctomycetota bacterium]
MYDLAIDNFAFSQSYLHKLVDDVACEQWCAQPVPGRVLNPPAWVVGHLAWVHRNGVAFITGQPNAAPAAWKDLFAPGSKVAVERSAYPTKAELLAAYDASCPVFTAALRDAKPETLAQPAPERMRSRFPTIGHLVLGMITSHETVHLGQLSAWRRASGLPSAF